MFLEKHPEVGEEDSGELTSVIRGVHDIKGKTGGPEAAF